MDPNHCSCAQTPSNEEVTTQFSIQNELENITVEEGQSSTRKKKDTQIFFSIEEDKLLISL